MQPEDQELENDELEGAEPEESKEPEKLDLPADPNEPIQIETDEAKVSKRRQARQERQNKFRQMEEDNRRLRQEMDEIRQRAYQPPQAPPQQQRNPHADQIERIDNATAALHREYEILATNGKMTPQLQEEYNKKALHLQTAKMAAVSQAAAPQIDREAIVREAMWAQFANQHSDVFFDKNPNVKEYAWALYRQKIAMGVPDTMEMVDEVLDQTRIAFGKQPRKLRGSRPDAATKARFTGVPSRGGGGGDMGEEGKIEMNAHDKRMARIAFGDKKGKDGKPWSEQQVYQHWANTVGKKRAAQKKTG